MLHVESTLSFQMSDDRLRWFRSHHWQLCITSKSVWLSTGRQVTPRSAQRSWRESRAAQVRLSLVCLLFSIDLMKQSQYPRTNYLAKLFNCRTTYCTYYCHLFLLPHNATTSDTVHTPYSCLNILYNSII